jgi:hypothetical protein
MPSGRIRRIAIHLCAIVLPIAAEDPLLAGVSDKETTQITGGLIVGIMKMAGRFSSQARKAVQSIASEVDVSANRTACVRSEATQMIGLDARTITRVELLHQN